MSDDNCQDPPEETELDLLIASGYDQVEVARREYDDLARSYESIVDSAMKILDQKNRALALIESLLAIPDQVIKGFLPTATHQGDRIAALMAHTIKQRMEEAVSNDRSE